MTLADWKVEDYHVDFKTIFYSGPSLKTPIELIMIKVLKYLSDIVLPDSIKAILNDAELSGLLLLYTSFTFYFRNQS